MRDPFELAVELAGGRENRNLPHARRIAGLVAQVLVDRVHMRGNLRTVELDAGRSLQPGNRPTWRDRAVIGGTSGLVQILAPGQRQTKS